MQRRNLLLGLGSAAAGSALLGSGAVAELTAERGINVQVAQDSQALIALKPTQSTYSNEYFNGGNNSALIDLGNPNSDNSDFTDTGINYDSTAYFDDVFAIENRSASATDVTMPVNTDGDGDASGAFESDDQLNVELYQGNRSTSGAIELINDVSPLTLSVGESKNVGVKVQVPPRNDDSLSGDDFESLSGDLELTAESRVTLSENVGTDAAISYQTGNPGSPKISSKGSPDSLDLGFTFDNINDQEAQSVFVEFSDDGLVDTSGDAAGAMDGDSINVGNSLDVSSVTEVKGVRDNPTNNTAESGDFAQIKIDMQDPIVSQSDSPDIALNAFKVELEDPDGPSADVRVRLEDGSNELIAETGFEPLQ